jgi:hypothetical protein
MHRSSECAFLLGAIGTLGALVAALEVSVAAGTLGAEPVTVNRTFKGDRSPALPGASRVLPEPAAIEPRLPDGCVAESEWRSHMYSAEIPGRCLA